MWHSCFCPFFPFELLVWHTDWVLEKVARSDRNAFMQEADHDILLHAKLIARDSEGIGSSFHIDKPTRQALEGTQEAPRSS